MAASSSCEDDGPGVAHYLKELAALGLADLAPPDELEGLIQDYFIMRTPEEDYLNEEELQEAMKAKAIAQAKKEASANSSTREQGEDDDDSEDDSEEEGDRPLIEDLAEEVFKRAYESACSCQLGPKGTPCFRQFTRKLVEDSRSSSLGLLDRGEDLLDDVLKGQMICRLSPLDMLRRSKEVDPYPHKPFTAFRGLPICCQFFMFQHFIDQKYLFKVADDCFHFGLVGRKSRGKKRKKPSFTIEEAYKVTSFVLNFSNTHAIHLLGKRPAKWKDDVRLLPAKMTRKSVYDCFYESAKGSSFQTSVHFGKFCAIWREFLPHVALTWPPTDLCGTCDQGLAMWKRPVGLKVQRMLNYLKSAKNHLEKCATELIYYQRMCTEPRLHLPEGMSLTDHTSCSFDGTVHYSLGSAQPLLYPSDPLQPGPLLLKAPRRCELFGVACEALSSQVTFLQGESVSAWDCHDRLVSYLHFFLEHFGLGETTVHLSADNHSGQYINDCVMQYLAWRVLTGRHRSITLSFVMTGHTRLSCDWFFGLAKRRYRRTRVDCLDDIANVVKESCPGNIPQKCGTEDGTDVVPVYSWSAFLKPLFHPLGDVKKFHHFCFSHDSPSVSMKEFSDSAPETLSVRDDSLPDLDCHAMPEPIAPQGLSPERQWYLYDQIRSLVNPACQDMVAPRPTCDRPAAEETAGASST